MEFYAVDAKAYVPPEPDKYGSKRCCESTLIQEQRGNMFLLGSLIFDALNSPYSLVNILRTVITLLTAWRAHIPDESPWYVFKNYCESTAGFVFNSYMSVSLFDDIAPGPLRIQQEKDPNAADINRVFDGRDAPLEVALIKAVVASADQNLTAALLNPPRATDLSLNTVIFASDGGSSIDGIPVKNPNLVDGSLRYAQMAESTLLGKSVGTTSMNLTSPTCGALHAIDLSLNTASAPTGGSPGYVNDAVSRSYSTRSRSSGDGGGRRSLGDSFRSLSGF